MLRQLTSQPARVRADMLTKKGKRDDDDLEIDGGCFLDVLRLGTPVPWLDQLLQLQVSKGWTD